MRATHSLHSKSTGNLEYLLHDAGNGKVFVRNPQSEYWGLSWYATAMTGALAFEVRKVSTFKGNK